MISERTKDKMLARAQKGLWNGGIRRLAILLNKQLMIQPEEAAVVRQMYDLYTTTRSLAQVVDTNKFATSLHGKVAVGEVDGGEATLGNSIYAEQGVLQ